MSQRAKITVLLMCKNSGMLIIDVIKSWLEAADAIVVLDTGSTDKTIEHIKTVKRQKVKLYQHEFEDFSTSRNRLIKIAERHHKADYYIMIDDSYMLVEKYKGAVRDELSIAKECGFKILGYFIQRQTEEYPVVRIFTKGNRYTGKIHEVIDKQNDALCQLFYVEDIIDAEHIKRTHKRMENDLKLFRINPTPRNVYFEGNTLMCLGRYDEAMEPLARRIEMDCDDAEEKFQAAINLIMAFKKKENTHGIMNTCQYLIKNNIYPERHGEIYYTMYELTRDDKFLKKAKESPLGTHRFPVNKEIYDEIKNL